MVASPNAFAAKGAEREVSVVHALLTTRPAKSQRTEAAQNSPTAAKAISSQNEADDVDVDDDEQEIQNEKAKELAQLKTSFTTLRNGRKKCIHCSRSFSAKSGPSTLKYHVKTSCLVLVHRTQPPVFTNGRANDLLCRLIVEDCLSLRLTESVNLRAFVDYLKPGYKPPCRQTLTTKLLPKIEDALKKTVKEKLASIDYFSISFDGWTSISMHNFIAVLCHGITSDWKFETFLLKIASVTESENADFIAEVVKEALRAWGIPLAAVTAAATDGASAMRCCVEQELELPWMYCAAHVINRSIFLALASEPIKTVVEKAKAVCNMFRFPQAKRLLRLYQEQLNLSTRNLKLCCPTRWGSVKKMLKRLTESRPAIALYLARHDDEHNSGLVDKEWAIIKDLLGLLCHLNEASLELSRQKVPTVGLIVPIFANIFKKWLDIKAHNGVENRPKIHRSVVAFTNEVVEDLRHRWAMLQVGTSTELLMSAYLDPRTKDFAFVEDGEEREECLQTAMNKTADLAADIQFEPQARHFSGIGTDDEDGDECHESPTEKKERTRRQRIRLYGAQAEAALRPRGQVPDLEDELAYYSRLQPCPLFCSPAAGKDLVTSDPLAWWKEHQYECPRLARLARRYLCITPTSVPCETAFSKSGWIVNKRRCSLSDDRVSSLLFVSFNKHHRGD